MSNVHFVSIGANCWPKMLIRSSKRSICESLPYDFNINSVQSVVSSLDEVLRTKTFDTSFQTISSINSKTNEMSIVDRHKTRYVHSFNTADLVHKEPLELPASIDNICPDKLHDVRATFTKRFERLLTILDHNEDIVCFVRLETQRHNPQWRDDLCKLTNVLAKFECKQPYLIYIQPSLDASQVYNASHQFNYDFAIPVMCFNDYITTYDTVLIDKILESFEKAVSEPGQQTVRTHFTRGSDKTNECIAVLKNNNTSQPDVYINSFCYMCYRVLDGTYADHSMVLNCFETAKKQKDRLEAGCKSRWYLSLVMAHCYLYVKINGMDDYMYQILHDCIMFDPTKQWPNNIEPSMMLHLFCITYNIKMKHYAIANDLISNSTEVYKRCINTMQLHSIHCAYEIRGSTNLFFVY